MHLIGNTVRLLCMSDFIQKNFVCSILLFYVTQCSGYFCMMSVMSVSAV